VTIFEDQIDLDAILPELPRAGKLFLDPAAIRDRWNGTAISEVRFDLDLTFESSQDFLLTIKVWDKANPEYRYHILTAKIPCFFKQRLHPEPSGDSSQLLILESQEFPDRPPIGERNGISRVEDRAGSRRISLKHAPYRMI